MICDWNSVAAVHALRREIARQRMWELFERTQCSTLEARQRSVVEARRQAEREVGLPAGTLSRPKPTTRRRRLQDDQDAQQASSPCSQPPVAADHATDEQRVESAEGQRVVVESGDTDRCSPPPIEPTPAHRRQCVAEGSDLQPGGDPAKSKVKAARKRPSRKKRRGPRRTALPRARRAYELRMVDGDGLGRDRARGRLFIQARGPIGEGNGEKVCAAARISLAPALDHLPINRRLNLHTLGLAPGGALGHNSGGTGGTSAPWPTAT